MCLVAQSCLTRCNTMDCSLPGSSVHGILQARILEWVAVPSSRASSQPREWTQISSIAGGFFTIWASRTAQLAFTAILATSFPTGMSLCFLISKLGIITIFTCAGFVMIQVVPESKSSGKVGSDHRCCSSPGTDMAQAELLKFWPTDWGQFGKYLSLVCNGINSEVESKQFKLF